MEFVRFSPRQLLTLKWWNDSRFSCRDGIICDGSVRSGKTVAMSCGFVMWSMASFNGAKFAICGKTIEALRRNVIDLLPDMLAGVVEIAERRAENKLVISCGNVVNTYHLFGGKDESSYKLIQGMTLSGVMFDEVALMPRSFVEQAMARCSVSGSKFWFNCNPSSPSHWFYTEWIQRQAEKNILYLHFTMEDNNALTDEIRARYENLYNGVFYDRYIRGLWVAAEGIIYDMFRKEKHVVSDLPELTGSAFVSIDYGTQNPTAMLFWHRVKGQEKRWVCVREYYYDGRHSMRQKTDEEYADDLERFIDGEDVRAIIVDPSAASFIAVLRQRGLAVQKAENAVLDGIRETAKMMQRGDLLIHGSCQCLIRELQSYVWDAKAAEHGEDRPVKANDHACDAMRYFVMTVTEREVSVRKRRPRGL